MYRNITRFCFLSFFVCSFFSTVHAGVIVGGTRVIYDAEKKEASITVENPEKTSPFLIQSWIEEYPEPNESKLPFIITPPLFRLDAGQKNIVRILRSGGAFPEDRESVYWLNIKSIPSSASSDENRLLISVKTKLKLFYRPAALKNGFESAHKQLKFSVQGKDLVITNPTGYFISFNYLSVDHVEILDPGMVAPKSEKRISLKKHSANSVSWKAINDYGGVTELQTQNI